MSSYTRITKHPRIKKFELAEWLDDYYGNHKYGVRFPNGEVFRDDGRIEWEFKNYN